MVNGVKNDGEIQKGEGCDRLFSHIKEKILSNVKEGTFSGMMFSIS